MTVFNKSLPGSCLVAACLMTSHLPLAGQEAVPLEQPPSPQAVPAQSTPVAPKVERVSPGVFRVATDIQLDLKKREISFPAFCNQVEGLVEYALVHENGKTHESLFRTKIKPRDLQTTLLLARVQAASGFVANLWEEKREKMDVSSSRLDIMVSWKGKDGPHSVSLESMAANANTKKTIAAGSFVFNGSRFVEDIFMAEQSGSIVAIYADDTAMVNSGDYDANNDDVWIASKEAMPPLDHLVTFTLKFPQKKVPSKD